MDAVLILRQLWRRRLLVGFGVALALLVSVLVLFRVSLSLPPQFASKQYVVGVASAEALVDSPNSQVIDLGGGSATTDVVALTARARLLANIMATSPLRDQIARRAQIDPRTFAASAPSLGADASKPPSVGSGSTSPRGNLMTVYFNETLPIITVSVQAADTAVAARIATAAVEELGTYLKSIAAQDKVPDARRLTIDGLGAARSATQERGPGKLLAIVAFVLVLGTWCSLILVIARVAERWREAVAQEAGGDPAPLTPRETAAPPEPEAATSSVDSTRSAAPDDDDRALPERRERPRPSAAARPDNVATRQPTR